MVQNTKLEKIFDNPSRHKGKPLSCRLDKVKITIFRKLVADSRERLGVNGV
jgi:hypothetical protein